MSVVNKMLQDLESRKSQTEEIKADYQPPIKNQSKILVWLLVILAIAAIIFALTNMDKLFSETKSNPVIATTDAQSLPSSVAVKMTLAPPKEQLEPVQSPKSANNSATARVVANALLLPQKPETATSKLASISMMDAQDKPLESQNSTEFITQTAAQQPSSFSMTGSSQENNRSSLKQRISESISNNKLDLAQSLLYELLETEPDNIKARKKLASLQFAQGNYAQTKQLLLQGIELHPAKSDLRVMLARLHMVQKEPSQAMNILAKFEPSTGDKTEYLGYRAALAQQLKQTELAKADYQTLTTLESTNAKWWLGLAIAEDQLGDVNMAVKAYTRAESLDQLDNSVKNFIQQRIAVLTGVQ